MATKTDREKATKRPLPDDRLHDVLHLLKLARYFDERMEALYRQGRLPGAIYSGRGQEGTHVGVAFALAAEDSLFPTHRDLTAQLAKGLDLKRVMAQFWGRVDGYLQHGRRRPRREVGRVQHTEQPQGPPPGRWQRLVAHRDGGLDAQVARGQHAEPLPLVGEQVGRVCDRPLWTAGQQRGHHAYGQRQAPAQVHHRRRPRLVAATGSDHATEQGQRVPVVEDAHLDQVGAGESGQPPATGDDHRRAGRTG